ncbi:HAMP domain-containing histidine kinase [Patescibacteria group bacterium]|nr:HAMP domain-containing histidine kinase [Patescibacteria group bacterium]
MPIYHPLFTRRQLISTILIATLVVMTTGLLGFFFFVQGRSIMEAQIKDHLRTTAAISAQLFIGEELDMIRGREDIDSLSYIDMVYRLRSIKESDDNIEFAYLMRRTDDPNILEFVADADALNTFEESDANDDGVVDESEENSYPGDKYDISDVPAMQGEAFVQTTTDDEFTRDQWGLLISGYAPIFYSDGTVAGILGIDMKAEEFTRATTSLFSPVAFLLLVVLGLLISWYILYVIWRRRIASFKEIEKERSSMLQLMMHQIGSPLTIFRWFTEELQDCRTMKCNGMVIGDYLDGMQDGIEMLDTVFKGLVQADKVHTGSIRFEPKHTTINTILHHAHESMEPKLRRSKQMLELEIGEDIPMVIDELLIEGVVKELIINASVFSQEGSTITLSTSSDGSKVRFEVSDEGCGISEEDLPRVFEKFFRGSDAARYKPSGNGLGLFVAKAVIERIGGKIWIKSKKGKGTTVIVELGVG